MSDFYDTLDSAERTAASKASSPSAKTLAILRERGATFQKVEYWNPFAKRTIDLFGVIDIFAIVAKQFIGIQCTDGTHHALRIIKAKKEPRLVKWLEAGGLFEVWSWNKRGAGKLKMWELRIQALRIEDMDIDPNGAPT